MKTMYHVNFKTRSKHLKNAKFTEFTEWARLNKCKSVYRYSGNKVLLFMWLSDKDIEHMRNEISMARVRFECVIDFDA